MKILKVFIAALVVLAAASFTGCDDGNYTADVVDAGGSSADFTVKNQVAVRGTLVNIGDGKARDVRVNFTFYRQGVITFTGTGLVGDISRGDSASYFFTFVGPTSDGWLLDILWNN